MSEDSLETVTPEKRTYLKVRSPRFLRGSPKFLKLIGVQALAVHKPDPGSVRDDQDQDPPQQDWLIQNRKI
jgi:hypothetical protein